MDSLNDYLQPTYFIDFNSDIVHNLAEELKEGVNGEVELAKKIFEHVRDNIKYSIEIFRHNFDASDFKASTTIIKGKGFCIPKSITLVALLRAVSIPARLHFADIINHRSLPYIQEWMGTNIFIYHTYVEIYLNDNWIKVTPSFETVLCKRHNLPVCDFDGINDAIFQPYDNLGRPFVEYVKDRGTAADLPYQEIIETFEKDYGKLKHV